MSNIASTLSLNLPAITALCVGPRGSLIFAASGLPNNTNNTYGGNPGLSGDFYIDTSTGLYYGPKTINYPSNPLFTLNTPASAFVYTYFNGVTSLISTQYGNNTINLVSNNSAILGGVNNSLTGNNSFIIGSNITANVTDFTLVNNLSSTGVIFASAGNSNQWYIASTNVSANSGNWQSTYTNVSANSANWQSTYTNVSANSANWQSTYTNVSANSANWQNAYTNYYNQAYLTYAQYTLNTNLSSIVPARGTFNVTGSASNIGGGNFNNVLSAFSSVLGGKYNTASGYYSNITGGFSGQASGRYSNIAGGVCNTASGYGASIAGGTGNVASGSNATIGAGAYNTASNSSTFIGGGRCNTASGVRSIVIGGLNNTASGNYSFVAGSSANNTKGFSHAFILGTGLSAASANYTYVNNISSQGIVSDSSGSSTQWNATYTAVSTTSAAWQNTNTTVVAKSASWTNAYTYLNTNTATTFAVNNFTAGGTGAIGDNTTIGYVNGVNTGLYLTKGTTYGVPAIQGITTSLGVNQAIAINPQGGNVGIGTVNPNSGKLHVQRGSGNNSIADIYATDSTQWIHLNSNEAAASWNPLVQNNDASIIFSAGTIDNTNSAIVIGPYSASAKGIRINNSGYVGISTATPNTNLTVNGNLSSTNIYASNNVGIGTSTPNYPLTVNGVISATNSIVSSTSIYGTSPNSGVTGGVIVKDAVSNPNAAYLQFVNNAASVSYGYVQGLSAGGVNIGGGNVGIGTVTPNTALTIVGNISATGNIITNGIVTGSNKVSFKQFRYNNGDQQTSTFYRMNSFVGTDGNLYVAGYGAGYCPGNGNQMTYADNGFHLSMIPLAANETIKQHYMSGRTMYVLTNLGNLWGVGYNGYGQLGVGDTTDRNIWVKANITNVLSFYCSNGQGGVTSCYAIRADGIYAWGYGGYGQLGTGGTGNPSTPTLTFATANLPSGQYFTKIACNNDGNNGGSGNAFALTSAGALYAVGYNGQGGLGLGDVAQRNIWTSVNVSGVTNVWINQWSGYGTSYILVNNTLYAAGYNGYGQFGNGTVTNSTTFVVAAGGITNISTIALGSGNGTSVIALLTDGTVRTWGFNSSYQLGTGNTTQQNSPYNPSLSNIIKVLIIDVNGPTTYALDSNGSLWSAGYNGYGQSGNGNTGYSSVFYAAVKSGSIKFVNFDCWGENTGTGVTAVDQRGNLYSCGYNGQYSAGVPWVQNPYISVMQPVTIQGS
jgi:alpha-tubulin suppressor-like RCC1 family protein